MSPSGSRQSTWRGSLISAVLVLAILLAIGALILAAQRGGRRMVLPSLGAALLVFAFSAQSNRARIVLAFAGGALIRG